jgi:hypothetical protein
MTPLAALVATAETPEFVALTVHVRVEPTSPAVSTRVAAVAPAIGDPARFH